LDHSRITSLGGTYEANVTAEVDQVHLRHSFRLLRCTLHFRDGSIAPNAARVLQQRMSVAPRKRQLATKVRRVVKGQQQTHALQQNQRAANRKTASRRSLRNPITASAAFFRFLRQPSSGTRVTPPGPPCRRSTSQSQRRHRPGIMFARRRARGDARGQRDVSPVIPGGVLVLLALADADFACPPLAECDARAV
jgi:hypothetical protein